MCQYPRKYCENLTCMHTHKRIGRCPPSCGYKNTSWVHSNSLGDSDFSVFLPAVLQNPRPLIASWRIISAYCVEPPRLVNSAVLSNHAEYFTFTRVHRYIHCTYTRTFIEAPFSVLFCQSILKLQINEINF